MFLTHTHTNTHTQTHTHTRGEQSPQTSDAMLAQEKKLFPCNVTIYRSQAGIDQTKIRNDVILPSKLRSTKISTASNIGTLETALSPGAKYLKTMFGFENHCQNSKIPTARTHTLTHSHTHTLTHAHTHTRTQVLE